MIRSLEPQRHIAVFPASLQSAGQARAFVQAGLTEAGVHDAILRERLTLVTSELVANAVVHACTEVEVRVTIGDEDVWVEVADAAPTRLRPAPPSLIDTSGRGLLLVDALADSWGVAEAHHGGGKTVWTRLSRVLIG